MNESSNLLIGGADGRPVVQLPGMSSRHGLIAGATGTGKTVTLQVLAEGFSRLGVPVFAADIKGDLSGLAAAGKPHPRIEQRLQKIPLADYVQRSAPVLLWDVFGEKGHPIRATISEMGPLLLSNLLDLNETQSGVLYACFRIADDQGLVLLDLKDLRAMLAWSGEHAGELRATCGNLSPSSIGAIQRRLLVLEEEGGDHFFGEPALKLDDLMHVDFSGQGVISLLDATRLASRSPRVYATFLLWLLSELFEQLPEAGEAEKLKLVFFSTRPPALQPGPQGAESRQNGSSSAPRSRPSSNRRQGMGEALLKSAARSIGSQIGRQIVRGILGSIFGGRR